MGRVYSRAEWSINVQPRRRILKCLLYGGCLVYLVPASPLAPGEYAIIIAGEIYTFGVD
jgi:hypothetical protein